MKLQVSLVLCFLGGAVCGRSFQDGKTDFDLDVNGRSDHYAVRMVAVLPSESVEISATQGQRRLPISIDAEEGNLSRSAPEHWVWHAPQRPGMYPISIRGQDGKEVRLNAFVLVPYFRMFGGKLEGYRIGAYPASDSSRYERPRGFIGVTPENQDTMVSPHFRLKQFLCKQGGTFPKFLVLREALLGKLERILESVNAKGIPVDTLYVMSGYRTPHYNRVLGNVSLSRHMYGDAADVFPEGTGTPGRMADLNGDGKVDILDSKLLHQWIEELEKNSPGVFPAGGVGVYEATPYHGPFVHIDARGKRARWSGELAALKTTTP